MILEHQCGINGPLRYGIIDASIRYGSIIAPLWYIGSIVPLIHRSTKQQFLSLKLIKKCRKNYNVILKSGKSEGLFHFDISHERRGRVLGMCYILCIIIHVLYIGMGTRGGLPDPLDRGFRGVAPKKKNWVLDAAGSYILYYKGEVNTIRIRDATLNICWFSQLRVSTVNF